MNKILVQITLVILGITMLNAQKTAEEKMIQVLITSGGHEFEEAAFFEMFDKMPGIEFHHIQLPDSADLLKPGLEQKYDVIVMYDMVDSINEVQQRAFKALLKNGIGLIALHHNLGAHRGWEEYVNIIGGKYVFEAQTFDSEKHGMSDYSHDVDFTVIINDKNHPITQGMENFQIHDETYKNFYVSAKAQILLTTDCSKSDPEIAWVSQYKNSPVFYLQLGHDSKAWTNPNYSRVLLNAIHWAAKTKTSF